MLTSIFGNAFGGAPGRVSLNDKKKKEHTEENIKKPQKVKGGRFYRDDDGGDEEPIVDGGARKKNASDKNKQTKIKLEKKIIYKNRKRTVYTSSTSKTFYVQDSVTKKFTRVNPKEFTVVS